MLHRGIEHGAISHGNQLFTGDDEQDLVTGTGTPERIARQARIFAILVAPPPNAAMSGCPGVFGNLLHRIRR